MTRLLPVLPLLAALAAPATAAPLAVGPDDTVQSVLGAQQGKRVTVRLTSGEELTGTVQSVGTQVVHLRQLAGKDFYDAAVALPAIIAVIVLTRD
ncbi:hypothetical protein EV699_101128 [Plasticicumulans lactativorans]|uniref:Uncharacterized protein n=1 Tax=Plasticicumulans lactativorans TaxID=1133106 RepID=A0A4R2LFY2_9GAMM|nr:hypothetical protein [Plasticicumulans lactativorans]TCO83744.1 hypothetical protein EV699_101128 [Plasticicumulans lactativorans]